MEFYFIYKYFNTLTIFNILEILIFTDIQADQLDVGTIKYISFHYTVQLWLTNMQTDKRPSKHT